MPHDDPCSYNDHGSPCGRPAISTVRGQNLCKRHAVLAGAAAPRRGDASGWNLRADDAARFEEISSDPRAVDPRGLMAVQRVFVEKVIAPSDDTVMRRALDVVRKRWTDDEMKPTEADITPEDVAEVMDTVHRDALYYLDKLSQRGVDIYKVLKVEETLMNRVVPIVSNLGAAITRVLEENIKDPALLELIQQQIAREATLFAAELRAAGDEVKR